MRRRTVEESYESVNRFAEVGEMMVLIEQSLVKAKRREINVNDLIESNRWMFFDRQLCRSIQSIREDRDDSFARLRASD